MVNEARMHDHQMAATSVGRATIHRRWIRFAPIVAAVLLCGCVTMRDVKNSFSNLNLRNKDKQAQGPDDFDVMGERNPTRIVARDLQPANFMTTMRVLAMVEDEPDAAQKLFDEGRELYSQAAQARDTGENARAASLFHRAANKFREAAYRWPDSALEEEALFMQGESFFFADQYVLANRAFESLIARFAGTTYLDVAESRRFAIAQYWLQMAEAKPGTRFINVGNKMLPTVGLASEGRRILHRIRLDDPTGKLADDATMALGNAYFRALQYQDAADAYDDLRKSYPASPHQFDAHLFQIKSLLKTYAGPDYDGAPLEKADQLMQAMVRQFPKEVGEQQEYLAGEATRIRNMLADRDFQAGQFYEARGENLAAEMYYNSVAERFDDTELAKKAEERIAAVGEKEPSPVQPVAWFVDLFPEPKSTRPLIPNGNQGTIYR
jgi:outer membrane protein assembly factor BamD (BamD/ComL family)